LDSLAFIDQPQAREVGELYELLATRLERIVRHDVRASDAVIEDACQFAWSRFLHHREDVRREAALSWLATTAVREALKLVRLDDREPSLEAAIEIARDPVLRAGVPGPDELLEQVDRLQMVGLLPVRQQRLMWLQGLGLSYEEMAAHEGCTRRTVERQLLRARETIRLAAGAEA
jgi:RNA polymerase sigma factor (sigma-70 family)